MSTRRPSRARYFVVAALCLAAAGFTARPARAQSLADIAKKEEERRQKTGEPAKVYTNKDLKGSTGSIPVPALPSPPPAAGDAPKDGGSDAKAKGKDGGSAGTDVSKDQMKDPAFWSGRLKGLKDKLDQDQAYAEAMQTRINALTTDFVNRDDPIQRSKIDRDRQKALADLARLTKDIADDQKAIADFEEQARRAGIPPGWLR